LSNILDPTSSGTIVQTYYNLASYTNSESVRGAVKITLPVAWTDSLFEFTIRINDGSIADDVILNVVGNNASSSQTWLYTSAFATGSFPGRSVRLGYDGTHCCLIISSCDTQWTEPTILVSRVDLHHSTANIEAGWSAEIITDDSTISHATTI
jgi:hypothetical protein